MTILITGTAGFVGFHTAKKLLEYGHNVIGIDALNDYYDVSLKESRNNILKQFNNYKFFKVLLEDKELISKLFDDYKPDIVIHLAAQAGVRYSLEEPRTYINSNIIGTFNILEECKRLEVRHLMFSSTSSVYGANKEMPFKESQKADSQMNVYSASKKACESLCHSYSHLWGIPITVFRFFTVYGTYGRPDLALFKFTKAIINDEKIDVYNNGEMYRDFTYIDDLVKSINLLMSNIPSSGRQTTSETYDAPFRIVNIGNSKKVNLMKFIETLEIVLQKKAKYNFMPLQMGDVIETHADSSYLYELTGYVPNTDIKDGIKSFVNWYLDYYKIKL